MRTLAEVFARCIATDSGCLEWTGAKQWSGKKRQLPYPHMRFGKKCGRGNRIVYAEHYKQEPGKKLVLHTCDNSLCLNPEHFYLGDQTKNMQDKLERNRDHNKVKTECKNGHSFSGDNLITRKNGARSCRQCMRKYWNEYDAKNREERRVLALTRYHALKEVR